MARRSIRGRASASKVLVSFAAVGAASALVLSACNAQPTPQAPGTLADCATSPLTCNSGPTQQGGTFTYTVEKDVTGWNLDSANSNTFDIAEILSGVVPAGPFLVLPDFSVVENPDFVTSVDVASQDPLTIVYNVKPEAVWNDGTPIGLEDFLYKWRTNNLSDCPDTLCPAASGGAGYTDVESVVGSNNGKTITVTFATPFADWKQLFGTLYPAHIAAGYAQAEGLDLTTAEGLGAAFAAFDDIANVPDWSGGPYIIDTADPEDSVTLVPNPAWYGAVQPSLDTLAYKIITTQTEEVPALQANEVQAIYPQPNEDIVNQVKNIPGVSYISSLGLVWEHIDLNSTNPLLADIELRKAIFLAINRQDIIDKTVGVFTPGLTPLGSHNFVPGNSGYQDLVGPTAQGDGDLDAATAALTAAGYTGVGTDLKTPGGADVSLRFSYTEGNSLREQTGQLVQSYLAPLGIDVVLTPVTSLGGTLVSGDFDIIIFAWVGTPFPYAGGIQLWGSASGSNFTKFNNAESDGYLAQAAQETNTTSADGLLNQSNELLIEANVVLPLFQKPTFLAAYNTIVNLRDNATSSGPPYNVQDWGLRAT